MEKKAHKKSYYVQIVIILAVFFFVLFNLVFKLVVDMRTEALEKQAREQEELRIRQEFVDHVDERYQQVKKLFEAKEYDKAIEIIKIFNRYDLSDYKDLPEMKKAIRLFYLKKKIDFIPKINLDEYMKITRDIDIEEDDSTEVFIRQPRFGQYFYVSDLPVTFEAVALSTKGDFSDQIVWISNKDGEIGQGKKIDATLSVGEHLVTAKSTNGETTGEMSIRVFIEDDPDFLKHYNRN